MALLGALFLWRGKDYYSYFLILSAALFFLGLAAPILLMPIHKVWMTLAVLLGWLMTRIILSVLFYLVITPIGLLARYFRKDFLDLKFDKGTNSYWVSKKEKISESRNYEKQF